MTDTHQDEFIYQIHAPETGRSSFFTGWQAAMHIAKFSPDRGLGR